MTYAAWGPRHRVTTITPGKLDLFSITMIEGRCAYLDPIDKHDAAVSRAQAFLELRPCQIKVLSVTGREACNLFGITAPDQPEPIDPALRQQFVTTLTEIARKSSDTDARRDAFDLLSEMGVIQP